MEIILGGLAVLTAAFLAGVVGFAYGLVAVPLLLLVGVPLDLVVPINLVIALLSRLLVLQLSWTSVTWARVSRMVLGSAPGAAVGVTIASALNDNHLQVGAALIVLLAVAAVIAVQGRQARPGRTKEPSSAIGSGDMAAGAAGGLLGAITSINGIPPALLMAHRRTPAVEVVADLSAYFIVGNLVTLGLLALGGGVRWSDAAPYMLVWLPAALAGTRLGAHLGPRLSGPAFRRLTLGLVLGSALVGLVDGLRA